MTGGMVTAAIPIGTGLGAALGAFVAPTWGWRALFVIGLLPAALTLLIRAWVPESPRWLMRMGRFAQARESLAWALEKNPSEIQLPAAAPPQPTPLRELLRHTR